MNDRIKYKKSQLKEVIYQVNFPPVLSIEAMSPYEFQESIRDCFPEYQEQNEQEGELIISPFLNQDGSLFNKRRTRKLHVFISENGKWRLTLSNNMLSLSTIEYNCWEDMKQRFSRPIDALENYYKPSFYSRIALRYIDVFERDTLNLTNTPWNELFNPHICGCLNYDYEPSDLLRVKYSKIESEMIIRDVIIRLFAGTGKSSNNCPSPDQEVFILDCDYFCTGKFDIGCRDSIADKVHDVNSSFFRDAITSVLHNAMEPEKKDNDQ